jgi:hypothetical protein
MLNLFAAVQGNTCFMDIVIDLGGGIIICLVFIILAKILAPTGQCVKPPYEDRLAESTYEVFMESQTDYDFPEYDSLSDKEKNAWKAVVSWVSRTKPN